MEFLEKLIYNITQVHPLHAMIVHFPIGLTGGALFFMLLALWKRSDQLEKVAFANISLATVSVLVAAVTGYRDNIIRFGGEANNYQVKIALGVLLFIVTTTIAVARWKNPDLFYKPQRGLYVTGYFLSFGIALMLGFLGGVIIYGF